MRRSRYGVAFMRLLRKILMMAVFLAIVGGILAYGVFLQELGNSDLPETVQHKGLSLPLQDPILVVSTGKMTLSLFDGDVLIKRYDAGFGREVPGRLGPGATPFGEFRIVGKRKRKNVLKYGSRLLIMDYPSVEVAERAYANQLIDQDTMQQILAAHASGGEIPSDTPLGGPIGIQGNFFSFRGRRCTDGSVALSNGEINELFDVVPLGTPIVIEP